MDKRYEKKSPCTSTYLDIIPLLVRISIDILDHQTLDLVTDGANLGVQVTGLVGGDAGRNNGTRNTGSTAESQLAGDVDVRNVLVLAEERKVENDGERGGVGSENHELGGTAVEGLGGFCETSA